MVHPTVDMSLPSYVSRPFITLRVNGALRAFVVAVFEDERPAPRREASDVLGRHADDGTQPVGRPRGQEPGSSRSLGFVCSGTSLATRVHRDATRSCTRRRLPTSLTITGADHWSIWRVRAADALRSFAPAIDFCSLAEDDDPVLGSDLAIGLGTARRQTGDPASRDTVVGGQDPFAVLGWPQRRGGVPAGTRRVSKA